LTINFNSPYLVTPGLFAHLESYAFYKNYSLQVSSVSLSSYTVSMAKDDFVGTLTLKSILVNQSQYAPQPGLVSRAYLEQRSFTTAPTSISYSVATTDLLYPSPTLKVLAAMTVLYQNVASAQSYNLTPAVLTSG
jgi:hypothetical protein